MKQVCQFISRWVAVIIILVAAGAMVWPEGFGVVKTAWITPLLGIIMFGMGLTLNIHDFRLVFTRPKDIIVGTVAQFVIMPLLAFLLTKLFRLPTELAVGVVLVGCCPGGTASNVMTFLARGDLALSVGITSVSTLLAPLLTPFLVWLIIGREVDVDVMSMFMSIIQVIILPILLGLLVKHFMPRLTDHAVSYMPAFSTIAIACIVAAVVSANSQKLMTCGMEVFFVVVMHNMCGFLLGFFAARLLHLSRPKCTAISIEVGMQNSGLACSLAAQHFQALALAPIPGAVFSVWHNVAGALAARLFCRMSTAAAHE